MSAINTICHAKHSRKTRPLHINEQSSYQFYYIYLLVITALKAVDFTFGHVNVGIGCYSIGSGLSRRRRSQDPAGRQESLQGRRRNTSFAAAEYETARWIPSACDAAGVVLISLLTRSFTDAKHRRRRFVWKRR